MGKHSRNIMTISKTLLTTPRGLLLSSFLLLSSDIGDCLCQLLGWYDTVGRPDGTEIIGLSIGVVKWLSG